MAHIEPFLPYVQMEKTQGDKWWLGLQTYENDGRFRWSDHSVLNYVAWALGRPQPLSRDRKCVYLSADKGKERRVRGCELTLGGVTAIYCPSHSGLV